VQDDQAVVDDPADTGVSEQPVFTFPTPQQGGTNNPVFVPMPSGGFGSAAPGTAPVITLQPGANGPTIYNFVPTEQQSAPLPGQAPAGFGVVGSPQPGMIQVPQTKPSSQTPPPTTRPPG
jgi:hypothetical protein